MRERLIPFEGQNFLKFEAVIIRKIFIFFLSFT